MVFNRLSGQRQLDWSKQKRPFPGPDRSGWKTNDGNNTKRLQVHLHKWGGVGKGEKQRWQFSTRKVVFVLPMQNLWAIDL